MKVTKPTARASLKLALNLVAYFDIHVGKAREIAKEVGHCGARRQPRQGKSAETEWMTSAFEHAET